MKATSLNKSFSKKNEKTGKWEDRFSYLVTFSTPEEQAEYKRIKGVYYLEDESGRVIWNSPKNHGVSVDLEINYSKDGINVNDVDIKQMKSIASQFDGVLGDKIADKLSQQIIDKMMGSAPKAKPTTNVVADPEVADTTSEKLDE